MARGRKRDVELELRDSMGWREYYLSGMRKGNHQQPTREMLVTHVDDVTGTPTYQGHKVLHIVTDGRGEDMQQWYVEVLYDIEYVQQYLYNLFTQMGLITNSTINKTLWQNWFDAENGKIQQYGATEGIRKQEEEDLQKAKSMAEMVPGTTVQEWLDTIKAKRQAAIEATSSETSNNGNGTAAKGKKAAASKA